jgi:TonB-linked SusC/RagA family outer membrane protein
MKTNQLLKPKFRILSFLLLFISGIVLSQQPVTLTGTIIDKITNTPVIGATITVQGKTEGVITDANGEFQLVVKQNLPLTLVVSFIGYETQEIVVYEPEKLEIQLASNSYKFKEIVISSGYTNIKSLEYSGAVSKTDGELLENKPAQSFDQLLGGQASGVNIISTSGELNSPAVLQIRGINSITSGIYPLVVVDGVVIQTTNVGGNISQNPLGDINSNDIQSIDVLKDAAATSIYGSRAANGVLVITTKKGLKGKPKINYDAWVSYSTPYDLPKLLGAEDYVNIKNEGLVNSGDFKDKFILQKDVNGNVINTNWQKVAFQNAISQNHSISVSGATDYTKYYLSALYSNQTGIIKDNQLTREGLRFNIDQVIIPHVNVGINFSFTNTVNSGHVESGQLSGQGLTTQDLNREIITLPPNVPIYNANGTYNVQANTEIGGGTTNASLNKINSYNLQTELDLDRISSTNNNAIGNVYAEWEIIHGLKAKTSYGLNFLNVQNSEFQNEISGGSASEGGSITNSSTSYINTDWVTTLNYTNTIATKHNINVTAGFEEVYSLQNSWGSTRSGLADPSFDIYQGGYSVINASNNVYTQTGLVSLFSNLNYNYNKRYLIGASFRTDGYSGLPINNQWGNFGGGSVGWNISEEDFFKNSSVYRYIDNFKIYGSYGEVGNTNIGAYPYWGLYSPTSNAGIPALVYSQAANYSLKWETSYKTDIGLTIGFLKDRIIIEGDYYNNNVDGLILNVPTKPSLGLPGNNVNANVGSLYNRGFEGSINALIIQSKAFSWNAILNISTLENKITSLPTDVYIAPDGFGIMNMTRQGYSIGSIFAVHTLGVDPANGNREFLNAKGTVVEYNAPTASWIYQSGAPGASAINNYTDGKIVGNSLPKYYGGFNNTFKYKGFDLGANFTFSGGNKIYDGNKATESDGRYFNSGTFILNRWTTPGQITSIPKITYGDNVSNGFTISNDYYVEDGSYAKLKNLSLGYTFKLNALTNYHISSIRLYAEATNVFTITYFQGGDPEISQYVNPNPNAGYGGSQTNQGYTRNSISNSRQYTFGLNLTF